ncbi:MAG: NAD-dependent epimerase/dehydratase family protein [Thaumarchaeota archaeon]|nr:NAD-dependent epimerase/dehydratase family protein [Nitrososphaerota archaeon]
MKILITGGAGFIGHNLAIRLKNNGFEVSVLDSLERSTGFAFERLKEENIPVVRAGVENTDVVKNALKGVDAVVHAAAYTDVAESMENPVLYLDNNALGTALVAEASLKTGVKLLIYLSSAAVYGDPVRLPIDENHPTNPLSPYGLSKLMGEDVVRFFSRLGLNYIVLRLFNVYGPGQNAAYAGVITRFMERVRKGLPPVVYGDGEQTRDFIHVEDVSQAVELAVSAQCLNQVFNIGAGKPVRIRDLAILVMRLHGVYGEPVYAEKRPGDIKHSYADVSKAMSLLGFKPRIGLDEGLKKLMQEP